MHETIFNDKIDDKNLIKNFHMNMGPMILFYRGPKILSLAVRILLEGMISRET